jgi:methyl-accepting chemotaxis protein
VAQESDATVDATLLGKLHTALDDMNRTMRSIAYQTDPAEASALISKVHRAMDDVNAMTATIRPDVTKIVQSGRASMTKIEGYVTTDFDEILTVVKDTNQRINRVAKDFNALSSGAREILAVNRVSINEMVDDMAAGGEAFRAAIEELRRAPWKLFHQPDEDKIRTTDIYNAAVSFASGAEQLDQALTKLQKLAEAHPEGIPETNVQLKQIREHLQEVFRRFRVAEKALWKEMEQEGK